MGRTKSGDPLVMTALDPVTFAKAVADQVVERLRKEGAASKSDSAAASTAALAKRVRPGDWWCLRWVCPAGDSQWRHCGREGRQPLPLSAFRTRQILDFPLASASFGGPFGGGGVVTYIWLMFRGRNYRKCCRNPQAWPASTSLQIIANAASRPELPSTITNSGLRRPRLTRSSRTVRQASFVSPSTALTISSTFCPS